MGQCVGPDICCGPFGCLMGTSDAKDCQKENDTPVACTVSGEPCGSRGQGNCVADGICCDSGNNISLIVTNRYTFLLFLVSIVLSWDTL